MEKIEEHEVVEGWRTRKWWRKWRWSIWAGSL
jgi:hypothetical protein